MVHIDTYLFYVSLSLYLLGTAVFFLYIIKPLARISRSAFGILITAFALHTLLLIIRWLSLDYFPVTDLHQSIFFFTWNVTGIFLIIAIKFKIPVLGSFITPLTALLLICSATTITNQPVPIPPALRSLWLPVHSFLAFVGEAVFGVAFCVGIMYLIQENQIKKKKWSVLFDRLPSLQTLDDLNYLCLSVGFPFLTLGIITGSIWAEYAWGSYWSWDPKETWALITWLVYAALLHGRLMIGWRGKRAALFAIIGFAAVLFTFFGVNLLIPGLHSYESLTSHIP